MSSIVDSLYNWANTVVGANELNIEVNSSSGNFFGDLDIQTGAINLINVSLVDDFGNPIAGYVVPKEEDGLLIFSPEYNSDTIGYKSHSHFLYSVNTGENMVLTPTSYAAVSSDITLQVYDLGDNLITELNLTINPTLSPKISDVGYNNDNLKTIINSMSSVVSSLYFALNN